MEEASWLESIFSGTVIGDSISCASASPSRTWFVTYFCIRESVAWLLMFSSPLCLVGGLLSFYLFFLCLALLGEFGQNLRVKQLG